MLELEAAGMGKLEEGGLTGSGSSHGIGLGSSFRFLWSLLS